MYVLYVDVGVVPTAMVDEVETDVVFVEDVVEDVVADVVLELTVVVVGVASISLGGSKNDKRCQFVSTFQYDLDVKLQMLALPWVSQALATWANSVGDFIA